MESNAHPGEADYLYRRLFGVPPSPEIVAGYDAALATLLPSAIPRRPIALERLMRDGLDPQALELYWRVRDGGPNDLTQRLHVLLYLAELQPDHQRHFTRGRAGRLSAWLSLTGTTLWTPAVLIKGWWHARRLEGAARG